MGPMARHVCIPMASNSIKFYSTINTKYSSCVAQWGEVCYLPIIMPNISVIDVCIPDVIIQTNAHTHTHTHRYSTIPEPQSDTLLLVSGGLI